MKPYPFKLIPVSKENIWGGTKLKSEYGKTAPFSNIAESWELSCHKNGTCRVADGPAAGMALDAALAAFDGDPVGAKAAGLDRFPLLIKFIDAADRLSVQVHPDDEYGMRVEGEPGKTEMWYVVDAEPGATLVYGLTRDMTKEELRASIGDGTFKDCLNTVSAKPGDVFFIPSGMIHAIGKGIFVAEIQENSDTTYRVYDYNRPGADGKPRPLHIDKAVDVAVCKKTGNTPPRAALKTVNGREEALIASCGYFNVWKTALDGRTAYSAVKESFHSILALKGSGQIAGPDGVVEFGKGDSLFVPAGYGEYTVWGRCEYLLTTL